MSYNVNFICFKVFSAKLFYFSGKLPSYYYLNHTVIFLYRYLFTLNYKQRKFVAVHIEVYCRYRRKFLAVFFKSTSWLFMCIIWLLICEISVKFKWHPNKRALFLLTVHTSINSNNSNDKNYSYYNYQSSQFRQL